MQAGSISLELQDIPGTAPVCRMDRESWEDDEMAEKKAVKTTKTSRATKKTAADEAEKPVKTTRKRQPKNAE